MAALLVACILCVNGCGPKYAFDVKAYAGDRDKPIIDAKTFFSGYVCRGISTIGPKRFAANGTVTISGLRDLDLSRYEEDVRNCLILRLHELGEVILELNGNITIAVYVQYFRDKGYDHPVAETTEYKLWAVEVVSASSSGTSASTTGVLEVVLAAGGIKRTKPVYIRVFGTAYFWPDATREVVEEAAIGTR